MSNIFVLNTHEILQILENLDTTSLKNSRLVCTNFNDLIQETPSLINRFSFHLHLGRGFVLDKNQPPLSFLLKSKTKITKLSVWDDFLEPGKSIFVIESNRAKLHEFLQLLDSEKNITETVKDLMIQTRDDEVRMNQIIFYEFLMKFKNLHALRFSMPSFVHVFNQISNGIDFKMSSIQVIEIFHKTFRRLMVYDFKNLLSIFPNTKELLIYASESMLLDKRIIREYSPLIKTITQLERHTFKDIADVENLHLDFMEVIEDGGQRVLNYLQAHPELKTCTVAFDLFENIFDREYPMITEAHLTLDDGLLGGASDMDEDPSIRGILHEILKYLPNLKKLSLEFDKYEDHNFGHTKYLHKTLEEVRVSKLNLDCATCCTAMLFSFENVKKITLNHVSQHLTVNQLTGIANYLKSLEHLAIFYDDDDNEQGEEILSNQLENWPYMPQLKHLILNKVGNVTVEGIHQLKIQSPNIETLKFYSMRGSNVYELIETITNTFPDIVNIVLRGGRVRQIKKNLSETAFNGGKGWRLKTLDISAGLDSKDICEIYRKLELLELIRCFYGSLEVTRRIYYEVAVLNAYALDEIIQPLKNRKRTHVEDEDSSDSETSESEESDDDSEIDSDFDDVDNEEDEDGDIIIL